MPGDPRKISTKSSLWIAQHSGGIAVTPVAPSRNHSQRRLAGSLMLLCLAACSSRPAGNALQPYDIGAEAERSVARTGQFQIRSKSGLAVSCICLFGEEDDPSDRETPDEAEIVRTYRSCSNSSRSSAYAPFPVSSGEGLIVILGTKNAAQRAEVQKFDSTAIFSRAINMHAPGCFKGSGAIIQDSTPALRVIDK